MSESTLCGALQISRRRILAGMGAALVVAADSHAQRSHGAQRGAIDVHHHVMPPIFLEGQAAALRAEGGFVSSWSPQVSIDEMDKNGVAAAVLSISTPGPWTGDVAKSRQLARSINEYAAGVVKDHPRRFGFFATLSLPDVEGSLREIEYAMDTLGADGACILSSYDSVWPGDPMFRPIFSELNARSAVVHCHPTGPACCIRPRALNGIGPTMQPGIISGMLEFPVDTTRAILSLLYGGNFRYFTNLKHIFSHGGGALPMIVGRISGRSTKRYLPWIDEKEGSPLDPADALAQLRRLYFDTASVANPIAFAGLTALAPPSNILFGTDFPYGPVADTVAGLHSLRLSGAQERAIYHDNPRRLFPRLG